MDYRDTRAHILDPCIQEYFFLKSAQIVFVEFSYLIKKYENSMKWPIDLTNPYFNVVPINVTIFFFFQN